MPRSYTSLTLDDATRMLQAGEAVAARLGVAYNIAVVDAGGNLVAFARQDGALIGSIELAIGKAMTARIFDKPTSLLAELAQPGAFFGDRIDIPLFPSVHKEHTFHGSFWGNNLDLIEVMALAAQNKIRHTVTVIKFDQINEYLERLRVGNVVGRAVVTF